MGVHDTEILEWAASENRLLQTHDADTMIEFAKGRIENNLPMPGIIEIPQNLKIGVAIDELVLLAECSLEDEWQNQIIFIPL